MKKHGKNMKKHENLGRNFGDEILGRNFGTKFWRRNFGTRKFGRHEIFMSRPKSSNYDLGLQRPERASNSASDTEIGIQQFVLTVQKKFNFDFEVENRFSAPKFLFRLNFRDFVFAKSKISL